MIEVENLVKRYGKNVAVDDLSFKVEKGIIYGFLGPNGAGKSTTMNIMTGYLAATEGTVRIDGHDIMKEPEEAKKCIGYLPELPPLYQDMTVEEYLQFAAELKKIPKPEKKAQIEEAMKMTMIEDVEKRLIRNLSKGYKQRVGLAQAILGNPEVIILDEPTVGLDPKQIIEIRDLIKTLGKKHTIILSSHILSEVSAICDQIMIISKGKLVACDTPKGLTSVMSGGNSLEISVLGTKEQLDKVLCQLARVENITYLESRETGTVRFILETEPKIDIRTELFYTLANAKLPLMSITRLEKSLEDVFLKLTDQPLEEPEGESIEEPAEEEQTEAEEREVREDDSNL